MKAYNLSQIAAKILNIRIKYENNPKATKELKVIDEILMDFDVEVINQRPSMFPAFTLADQNYSVSATTNSYPILT